MAKKDKEKKATGKKISPKVLATIKDKLTVLGSFKDQVDTKPQYLVRLKLDESNRNTAVISFGRMNPPTIGHQKLVDKVKQVARSKNGKPMVFLSHTQDSKKNPLSYSDKIKFARVAFGRDVITPSSSKTIIDIAKQLENNYDNLVMVVGDDRVREFDSLLNKYNGKDYSFETIEIVSAGTRDPDSSDVSGMSASKMRDFVSNDDIDSFRAGLPSKLKSQYKRIYSILKKTLVEAAPKPSTIKGRDTGRLLASSRAMKGAAGTRVRNNDPESNVNRTPDAGETNYKAELMGYAKAQGINAQSLGMKPMHMMTASELISLIQRAGHNVPTAAASYAPQMKSMLLRQQLPTGKKLKYA